MPSYTPWAAGMNRLGKGGQSAKNRGNHASLSPQYLYRPERHFLNTAKSCVGLDVINPAALLFDKLGTAC